MPEHLYEYYRPADLDTAQKILARPELLSAPLFFSTRPQAVDDWPADAVVDLSKLKLDYIVEQNGFVKLGALASLQSMVEAPILKTSFGGLLSRTAELSGTLGLRNYASLLGLLADREAPSEVLLALMVLDARIVVRSPAGTFRNIDPAVFISDNPSMQHGDLPVEVQIPLATGTAALERVARTPMDQSIVAAAVWLELQDGLAKIVRVAVSGSSALPRRETPVEKLLTGQPHTPGLLEKAADLTVHLSAPVADLRGSAEYRKAVAGIIVRRTVQAAWQLNA